MTQINENMGKRKNIEISEIFPNPKGKDENKEWIEITNYSKNPINLVNYKFKIISGTKQKEKIINFPQDTAQTINPNQALSINLTIPNSNTKILLLKNLQIIDKIEFDKSKEDKSLQKIHYHHSNNQIETKLIWDVPNKDKINISHHEYLGIINNIEYPIITLETSKKFNISQYKQTFITNFIKTNYKAKIKTKLSNSKEEITEISIIKTPKSISLDNTNNLAKSYLITIPIILAIIIGLLIYKTQNGQHRQRCGFSS